MKFTRTWAWPNADTFDVAPIGELVQRYLAESKVSVDPFARNKQWATFTNDLNPDTTAKHHMDAADFLAALPAASVDLALFDPPYSPRQISECYKQVGREVGMAGTQNGALYKRVRDALLPTLTPSAVVLSFGWNSAGMGRKRGFEIIEIMLVAHGGGHNDTICLVERRRSDDPAGRERERVRVQLSGMTVMDSSADSNNRFRTVTSCPACGRPLAPMEDSWTPRLELGCHGCGRVYHVGEEREREDGEWVVIGR